MLQWTIKQNRRAVIKHNKIGRSEWVGGNSALSAYGKYP